MAIAIVFWMQYQWQYQYQLFVEYNTNCNTNTNCFWNAISMAIPIPIVCVIQYQWQYQYQFFFLCNFNINCNSNTFNCLRTNSNVQAINSYWNLPISIAIPIVPDLHKQLSMAMAIPSKTAIPMAPQYYCSCLPPTMCHAQQLQLLWEQWKRREEQLMLFSLFFKTIDLSNCCQDSSLGGPVYTCSCIVLRGLA